MNAEPFKRTGIFLTAEQLAAVKEEFRLPVMMIGGSCPDPWKLINRYSMAQGMPETDRQRGADLKTGEILEFVPDNEVPEASPTREGA